MKRSAKCLPRGAWVAVVALLCPTLACADAACTEIDCENRVDVGYDTSVPEPYDLVISYGGETLQVRCNDDDSMEALENPEGVECDATGFSIIAASAAGSSLDVTLVLVAGDEIYVGVPVQLVAGEPIEPNGPGCPPVCYERSGTVVV